MKVTGYRLREALRSWEMRRKTADSSFTGSLYRFEGEDKPDPVELIQRMLVAEQAIVELQTAQTRYNLAVTFQLEGKTLTLCEAVKTVGGAGRIEKLWRSAATVPSQSAYGYSAGEPTMDKDQVRAKRVLSVDDASKRATQAAKKAGRLRAAIAAANAVELEMEGLPESLFE